MDHLNHYNIQALATEMFKVNNNLSETIFNYLNIREENTYNFNRKVEFQIPKVITIWKGLNQSGILNRFFCDLRPLDLKYTNSFDNFKTEIQKLKHEQ